MKRMGKEICAYKAGVPVSQDCLDLMAEYPKPNLEFIEQDRATLSIYSFWKIGPGEVTKFDAPGGSAIGTIPAGFNFINAIDTNVADWLQIQGGEWISRAGAKSSVDRDPYFELIFDSLSGNWRLDDKRGTP